MIKIYKANTNVSINVVLPNKKNLHISFTPLSNGSSTFTTDNPEVMHAIERHHNFGKMFRVQSVLNETKQDSKVTSYSETAPRTVGSENSGLRKVKVSDMATAKDYLAETCGISRTAMRSVKSIMEHAAANGIEFYGMDGE